MVPERMDFGIFMAPFHRTGENPTLCLQRDLKTVASAAGFIPTSGTRQEGTPPSAPSTPDGDGAKERVEEGAPGS